MSDSCGCSNDNSESVKLPADEIFRVLRVRTDFFKHRQDFHDLLRGLSDFTDHDSVLMAGVRYAGDEDALTINSKSSPTYVNVTENFAFSMFWTDPECTTPRLAFQVTGATPTHTAQGKIVTGPAQRPLFIGIELDKTMQTATVRELYINGKSVEVTPQTVKRVLDAVSVSMDDILANGRINFNEHLKSTMPAHSVDHIRARMARKKTAPKPRV